MKLGPRRIPEVFYWEIHRVLPIVCVDLVVCDGKGNFLLVKRAQTPEKGKWWFPGGRLLKHEQLEVAARRKLREELGVGGRIEGQLGVYEYESRRGYFPHTTAHTICVTYKVRIRPKEKFRLDTQSSEARWFHKIDRNFHPYLKNFLKKAGLPL